MKFQNNLIWKKMEELGIHSVAELCRKMGKPKQQAHVGAIINMKKCPLKKNHRGEITSEWRKIVIEMADVLLCLPGDLFSEGQLNRVLGLNVAVMSIDSEEIPALIAGVEDMRVQIEGGIFEAEREAGVEKALSTLTPREEEILRRTFGLSPHDEPQELGEIGDFFDVTQERVRQIQGKALRKLRHPLRARHLKPLLG